MGLMSKMAVIKVVREYSQVTAILVLACRETATRMKKLLIWMVPFTSSFVGWFHKWYRFNGNLMVSNGTLASFQ